MLRYVFDKPEIVANCVALLIPRCRARGFGKCSAIGVIDEDGKMIGGIVYTNWDPDAGRVEIHGAAVHPRWLTRQTIFHMFDYPFHQLNCQMVFQETPAEDLRLLGQLARYGYTFIKAPRWFGREKDGVFCYLTYEDWCGNRFNKRLQHHLVNAPGSMEEAA